MRIPRPLGALALALALGACTAPAANDVVTKSTNAPVEVTTTTQATTTTTRPTTTTTAPTTTTAAPTTTTAPPPPPPPTTRAPAPPPPPSPPPTTLDHPADATARCNDGTYSYAAHHQGACSHHGGVAVFYR